MDVGTLPRLSDLRLLWMNNCNIMNLSVWITKIRECCPRIKYLSMMENPGNSTDKIDYRSSVLCFLPTLVFLDDVEVTKDERIMALKNESCHLVQGLNFSYEEKPFDELKEDDDEYIAFKSTSYPD